MNLEITVQTYRYLTFHFPSPSGFAALTFTKSRSFYHIKYSLHRRCFTDFPCAWTRCWFWVFDSFAWACFEKLKHCGFSLAIESLFYTNVWLILTCSVEMLVAGEALMLPERQYWCLVMCIILTFIKSTVHRFGFDLSLSWWLFVVTFIQHSLRMHSVESNQMWTFLWDIKEMFYFDKYMFLVDQIGLVIVQFFGKFIPHFPIFCWMLPKFSFSYIRMLKWDGNFWSNAAIFFICSNKFVFLKGSL